MPMSFSAYRVSGPLKLEGGGELKDRGMTCGPSIKITEEPEGYMYFLRLKRIGKKKLVGQLCCQFASGIGDVEWRT
jgi:hypothetical protein